MNGDVLVQIGPLRLYALGTALAVSVLAGMAVALPEGRRRGIPQSAVLSAAASAMLGGWVGGRLAPSLLSLAAGGEWSWQSGELSYYGGLLAGTAGACWAARRAGVRAWRMLDAAAPALPFGLAVAAALLTRPSSLADGLPLLGGAPAGPYLVVAGALSIAHAVWRRRSRLRPEGRLFLMAVGLEAAGRLALHYLAPGAVAESLPGAAWALAAVCLLAATRRRGAAISGYTQITRRDLRGMWLAVHTLFFFATAVRLAWRGGP